LVLTSAKILQVKLYFVFDISVEETQDGQTFSKTVQHSASNDSTQFMSISIEGKTWYGCKVCGKRFQQWNMFKIHYYLHAGRSKFSASNMEEDDKCTEKMIHSIHDGFEVNETDNSEEATCSSYRNVWKIVELTTLKHDAADVVEDHEHEEEKISDGNVECSDKHIEVYTGDSNSTDGEKFEATQKMATYQCMLCYCCFEDGRKLQKHLQKHQDSRGVTPFKCSVCSRTFGRSYPLKEHAKCHNAKQPFACAVCDFQFLNITELCEHMKLHPAPFGCSLCHKRFGRLDHLCRHIKITHSNKRPYKCRYCRQAFKYRNHMIEHQFQHESYHFTCKICSSCFRTRHQLKQHMLETHNVGSWHQCPLCHHKFLFSAYLKEHLQTHKDQKPYACSECPRRYKSRSGLRTHLVWHSGVRNFSCRCCDRTFYRRSHVKSHFKIHLRQC